MTGNNNINKFIPNVNKFEPKPYIPETYQVAYLDNLYPELSYQDVSNQKGYGPVVNNPTTYYCAASDCYERIDDSLTYCSKHSQVSSSSSSVSVARAFADRVVEHGGEVEVKEQNLKGETRDGTKFEYHSSSIIYRKN